MTVDHRHAGAGRDLFAIIWPMLAIIVLLVALASVSLDILSAARAYVGGESLWSKGQKDAVYFLLRYIRSHRDADYQAYLNAIAVPYGDHVARLELNRKAPDIAVAAKGFLAGFNHPADVPGMIRLYRWFHGIGPMKTAIGVWTEADHYMTQLMSVAQSLHQTIRTDPQDTARIDTLAARIDEINVHFTPLEFRFSATLAKASRQIGTALKIAIVVAAILSLGIGLVISNGMLRHSRQYEAALRRSETRLREAQALAHLGNWSRDLATGRTEWSAEALRIFGFDAGSPPADRDQQLQAIHADDRTPVTSRWDGAARTGQSYTVEYRIVSNGGRVRWVQERGQCHTSGDENSTEMIATVMDITERKLAEEKIQRLAHYDEVTALPNRNLLQQHMQLLLARYQRHGGVFAMLFVDLDHFKEINDTRGHATGDRVLKTVAARLNGCLRESDMIARFGGDEFIVVIEGINSRDDVMRIAGKIRDIVAEPVVIDGDSHQVTASIGISVYPENGTDLDTLCKHADAAMYQAKDLGRNRYGFFDS